jgi:hypothetical protein
LHLPLGIDIVVESGVDVVSYAKDAEIANGGIARRVVDSVEEILGKIDETSDGGCVIPKKANDAASRAGGGAVSFIVGGVGQSNVSTGGQFLIVRVGIHSRHIQTGDGVARSIRVGKGMTIETLFGIEDSFVDVVAELAEEGSIHQSLGG